MKRAGIGSGVSGGGGSGGASLTPGDLKRFVLKLGSNKLNFVKKEDSQDTLENLELSLNHYAMKDLNYKGMGG